MSAENHGSVSRGLRRLLRTIRGKGKGNKTVDDEEGDARSLPFLPAQRPRPLTLTAA